MNIQLTIEKIVRKDEYDHGNTGQQHHHNDHHHHHNITSSSHHHHHHHGQQNSFSVMRSCSADRRFAVFN